MPSLAAIALGSPLMLAGLAALALPIAAHLLGRRPARELVFPSVALLRQAVAGGAARPRQLRRWALLALRCAAVALIVLAFARPVWLAASAGVAGEGAAVVLVIDNSASAAQPAGGGSALDAIRAQAGAIVDALPPGQRVNAVVAAPSPQPLLPQPTHQAHLLLDRLDGVTTTGGRADLPGAIALAGQQLADAGGGRIVVMSDMQRTNWHELADPAAVDDALPPGVPLQIAAAPIAATANLALAAPRVEPARPRPGRSCRVSVNVTNYSNAPAEARIAAGVGGDALAPQALQLSPWETAEASWDVAGLDEGWRELTLSLPADDLPLDDRAFLAIEVRDEPPVALITDDDTGAPATGGYYLARALAPRRDVSVRVLRSAEIEPAGLAGVHVVYLGDVAGLGRAGIEALAAWVRSGGALVAMVGNAATADALRQLDEALGQGDRLPWVPIGEAPVAAARRLVPSAQTHPLLHGFDAAALGALERATVERAWRVEPRRPDAQALLTFDNGTPALSVADAGAGRIVLANFSPAPAAGDLARHGAFVALVQALAQGLVERVPSSPPGVVGDTLAFTAPPPPAVGAARIITPQGAEPPHASATDGLLRLRANAPGFYRLVAGGATLQVIAVNPDPRESDLRPLHQSELAALSQERGGELPARIAATRAALLAARPRELWPWFVAGALMVMAGELILLQRFGKARA